MNIRTYNVGDLRKVIKESANEFKPKFGTNVESDNKKINDKAYKDITKDTKAYNSGIKVETNKKQPATLPDNKGMQDLEYLNMNKDFKERTKAQMKGYTSKEDEKSKKNTEFGNADYGTDEEYNKLGEKAKTLKNNKDTAKEIGLTSREIDKKEFEKLNATMFESQKLKKLTFKHTEFLSENHMMSKIPDDYKIDGNKFIMKDNSDNSFLVEWKESDKPNVTKHLNNTKVLEESNRIKELYGYKSKDHVGKTNPTLRIQENNEFSNMIGKVRLLMK